MKNIVLILVLTVSTALAHVGNYPSVHDVTATVLDRMEQELLHEAIRELTLERAAQFLTAEEREALGHAHLCFQANVPVTVSVMRRTNGELPFWLQEREFQRTDLSCRVANQRFEVWQKDFPAGPVGLGVNSLAGGGEHYFVAVTPKATEEELKIKSLYPGQARVDTLKENAQPYVDRGEKLQSVPPELEGAALIRTARAWRDYARLLNVFLFTKHPSSATPDHCILTWSGDPRTTQSIQWRTSTDIKGGIVEYTEAEQLESGRTATFRRVRASMDRIETPKLINDRVIHWHTAKLRRLKPATSYRYRLGDTSGENWTDWVEFTTAPDQAEPFSFIYMGDAQNGLETWGKLVHHAFDSQPEAAFYVMAGDLVNRGADRDDWDDFFSNAAGIYDRRQLVPAIGNHECSGGKRPELYLDFFDLPNNAPPTIERERAYSFEYSNALFVILDSNLDPLDQTYWLERRLARTKAKWKFVVYHHPAYSSAPNRDNRTLRQTWGPLFDKYHVDMALQGHDHAYLRTYPLKANQRVASPQEGTVYIVSVSGTKYYQQKDRDYTEFGMTNVSTYQVLDISISENQLVYRAYDFEGKLRDELIIEK